jgi:hypothetical protein
LLQDTGRLAGKPGGRPRAGRVALPTGRAGPLDGLLIPPNGPNGLVPVGRVVRGRAFSRSARRWSLSPANSFSIFSIRACSEARSDCQADHTARRPRKKPPTANTTATPMATAMFTMVCFMIPDFSSNPASSNAVSRRLGHYGAGHRLRQTAPRKQQGQAAETPGGHPARSQFTLTPSVHSSSLKRRDTVAGSAPRRLARRNRLARAPDRRRLWGPATS